MSCPFHTSSHPPSRPEEPLEPGPEETRAATARTLRSVKEGVVADAVCSLGTHGSADDPSSRNRKVLLFNSTEHPFLNQASCFLGCPPFPGVAWDRYADPRGALQQLGRNVSRGELNGASAFLGVMLSHTHSRLGK